MRLLQAITLLAFITAAHAEVIPTTQPEDPKPPAPAGTKVLVNQVGYDLGAIKILIVQTDGALPNHFEILDAADKAVFDAALEPKGRVVGAYNSDWGFNYAQGDFSKLDTAGKGFRVRIGVGESAVLSPPFAIGKELLWNETAMYAIAFFYYQRCGFEVPGFHKACHLDDAIGPDRIHQHDLQGGWHDAGDYNKYQNAPYVYGLSRAYLARREAFDALAPVAPSQKGFLDELEWGGAHVLRMLCTDGSSYGGISDGYHYWGAPDKETDNIPNTGDERIIRGDEVGNPSDEHAAALARLAFLDPAEPKWREGAERALNWCLANGHKGAHQCSAALDLFEATKEPRFAEIAKTLVPGASANFAVIDVLRRYDTLFHEDHSAALRDAVVAHTEEYIALSNNVFGIPTFGTADAPNYFNTPGADASLSAWHVGNSSRVLEAATAAALAFQYTHDDKYRAYAYRQFDWILGANPYALCLMEARGSNNAPTYHHRYIRAGIARGAVPGGIPNGITYRQPGVDAPYFDISGIERPRYESNEVWLPHNTSYVNALAALYGP